MESKKNNKYLTKTKFGCWLLSLITAHFLVLFAITESEMEAIDIIWY